MLYVVPTPLGNLEDMTARALRTLKESKVVFCEDTRRTRNLMSHFGLGVPLERYDENDPRSVDKLLERVRRGDAVSLVSDGGLPGVSDPGRKAVAAAPITSFSNLSFFCRNSAILAKVKGLAAKSKRIIKGMTNITLYRIRYKNPTK